MEDKEKNNRGLKHIKEELRMIEINYNNIEELPNEEVLIKKVVQAVLENEGVKHDLDIYITLTNNEEIHKINKEYRNIDRETDVITFRLADYEEVIYDRIMVLGDIYISLDKARSQSIEYGHSYLRELSFLVIHGFLHLLGYDHMNEEDEKIMFKLQEDILDGYGIKR